MAKKTIDEPMSVGIDIDKDTFHIVAFDADGQLVMRKQIKRLALVQTFKKLPGCVVGMEACLSAHFVSRTLRKMGFEHRIIPAIYVKPFIKSQKNDYNDADDTAFDKVLNKRLRGLFPEDPVKLHDVRRAVATHCADAGYGIRSCRPCDWPWRPRDAAPRRLYRARVGRHKRPLSGP